MNGNRNDPYQQYMYSYPHKTAYGSLTGIYLSDYMDRLAGQQNSLYIHLPFCQYKCGYCNLFSIAGNNTELMQRYVEQMKKQALQLAGLINDEIYFSDLTLGGGTPLLLESALLRQIFQMVKDYFAFDAVSQPVVVETSPKQTTLEKLELLKEYAVNRISIGVQSFQQEELETLYRQHSAREAQQALQLIQQMGFDCVNIDIIYGIPGQGEESLLNSLEQALSYQPEELFVYPLYVKPGTRLYQEGLQTSPDALELYRAAKDFLQKAGYVRKSMRRFVRREYLAAEGLLESGSLCGFTNTISLGCGGRSYVGNLHYCTPYAVGQEACRKQLTNYLEQQDFLNVYHGYLLNQDEIKRRYVIKHLLYDKGICRRDYQEHFGREVERDFPILIDWREKQLVEQGKEWISLTEEGMDWSDYLGPQFISEEVAGKMATWKKGMRI